MTLTPQTYCTLCVMAWAAFAIFFFRKDIFRKSHPGTASETDTATTSRNTGDTLDIIGQPKTVIDTTQTVAAQQTNQSLGTEELDVEYDYDQADLDDFREQADKVPPIELNMSTSTDDDLDSINAQIAAMHDQTDEEIQELLADTTTSFRQLSFAFDTAATPCRSIEDDRLAGNTLKDISRTDMFEQAYRANMRRVDEIMNNVSCKVMRRDNDELDVVPVKEEPAEDAQADDTEEVSLEAGSQDFINDFIN